MIRLVTLGFILVLLVSILKYGLGISDGSHSYLFATKTPYKHRIRHEQLPWLEENVPEGIKPILIDATLRHGTRFPSQKRVDEWKDVVAKFQDHISANDTEFPQTLRHPIVTWDLASRFPENNSYLLSSLGWEEHVEIGFKYHAMMSGFWLDVSANFTQNLKVYSSSKIRCRASARALVTALQYAIEGVRIRDHPDLLFNQGSVVEETNTVDTNNGTLYGNVSVSIDDQTIRYFDHCPKYKHTVDDNDTALHEFEKFFNSDTYKNILHKWTVLEKKEAYHLYQICTFETAVHGNSAWCKLFDENDMPALEYASDVKHYYKTGPGYSINYYQACVLLKSVIDHIVGGQKAEGKPKAILRFGHAETLLPLVSLLELVEKHAPLQAHNFEEHKERTFRTGMISPFAGNLAVIVYQSTKNETTYVSFVLNEVVVKPFGLDCYYCPFGPDSEVRKILQDKYRNTSCDSVCIVNSNQKDEL